MVKKLALCIFASELLLVRYSWEFPDILLSQEHACKSLCAADGVCEISTVPHAIESTFTGRHEVCNFIFSMRAI